MKKIMKHTAVATAIAVIFRMIDFVLFPQTEVFFQLFARA